MKIALSEARMLPIPELEHPDIMLRSPDEAIPWIRICEASARGDSTPHARGAWSTIAIIARAVASTLLESGDDIVAWAMPWMAQHHVLAGMVPYIISTLQPTLAREFALRVLRQSPGHVVFAANLCLTCPEEFRGACEEAIARFPDADVRERYFAFLGMNQQLVIPGSVDRGNLSTVHAAETLSIGISDTEPRVRVRAIALASAMDLVALVREQIVARLSDPDGRVRYYAQLALARLPEPR